MAGAATEKVLVRVSPTVLFYICLPLSCDSLQHGWCFGKGSLEDSPNCSSLQFVSQSLAVLCCEGLLLQKGFFGGFSQLVRSFGANGCCFRKGIAFCTSLHCSGRIQHFNHECGQFLLAPSHSHFVRKQNFACPTVWSS